MIPIFGGGLGFGRPLHGGQEGGDGICKTSDRKAFNTSPLFSYRLLMYGQFFFLLVIQCTLVLPLLS